MEQDIEVLRRRYSPLAIRRMALGISLRDLQKTTKITSQYLNEIERGSHWPGPPIILGLAEGFNLSDTETFELLLATWKWRREQDKAA